MKNIVQIPVEMAEEILRDQIGLIESGVHRIGRLEKASKIIDYLSKEIEENKYPKYWKCACGNTEEVNTPQAYKSKILCRSCKAKRAKAYAIRRKMEEGD